jgi:hypothetical protein
VTGLLIIGFVVVAVLVLYAGERVLKARAHARRLHKMNDRLTAAVARTDEQQEQRQVAAQASVELTSFMPAIKQPPLTVPDSSSRRAAGPETAGCGRTTGQREHGAAHPVRRPSRSGEHPVRPVDRAARR